MHAITKVGFPGEMNNKVSKLSFKKCCQLTALERSLRLPAICVQNGSRRLAWQRLPCLLREHRERSSIGEWSSAPDPSTIYCELWAPFLAVSSRRQREIKMWPSNKLLIDTWAALPLLVRNMSRCIYVLPYTFG